MSYHWSEFFYRALSLLLAFLTLFLIIEVYPESFLPWWEDNEFLFSLKLILILHLLFPFFLYHVWAYLTPGLYKKESLILKNGCGFSFFFLILFNLLGIFFLYPAIQTFLFYNEGQIFIFKNLQSLFFFLFLFLFGRILSKKEGILWRIPIWLFLFFFWSLSGWDSLSDFVFPYLLLFFLWELSLFWKR